ncbi:MAG: hypothetical protein LAT64_07050 [Phycisphaerales bacterium]|nr:hypothetical protein [Planctomycetota bacterium]MCH8508512.1 hypothetical protein [Phycisphaerales bacterium]
MASAQTMLASLLAALVAVGFLPACAAKPDRRDHLDPPAVLVAPYDTSRREVVWAVLQPRNESGTSYARTDLIGDELVAAVQQIRGVRCLPLNRAIEAAYELGMPDGPRDSADAIRLAEALGVDAVIASSITAYDPYDPPILGLALALYSRPGAMARTDQASLDSRALTVAFTDFGRFDGVRFGGEPVTVVSEHLDARDHGVLMALRRYASGRSDPTSSLRWRVYTASMELYTRFAAHHAVGRLIDEEWMRMAREAHAAARTP